MADLYQISRNVSRLTSPRAFGRSIDRFGGSGGLTEADKAIMPHITQAKGEFVQEKSKKGFLWKLFDVLGTGNYMSANVMDSIYDSVQQKRPLGEAVADALDAAWKGLSHQEKNTFSDVIKQNIEEYGEFLGKDEAQWLDPIIKGKEEDPETNFGRLIDGLREQFTTPAGLVGLAADVALDPLTYVNPLSWLSPMKGASTAARAAGSTFVDDSVRLSLLNKNLSSLKKIVGSDDVARQVKRAVESGDDLLPKLQGIVETTQNHQFARYLDDVVKEARKHGTLTPAGELQEEMAQGIGNLRQQFAELATAQDDKMISSLASRKVPYDEALKKIEQGTGYEPPKLLDDLAERVAEPTRYQGAGTRSFRGAFGEYGVREGKPNIAARGFDRLGEMIGDTPAGAKLSDAWWAFMNSPKSPVGLVKKALGIKNPYEQMVHQKTLDAQVFGHNVSAEIIPKATGALDELGEELQDKAIKIRALAERAEFKVRRAKTPGTVLNTADFIDQNPDVLAKLGFAPEELEKLKTFWSGADEIFKSMFDEEAELVAKGLLPDFNEIVNYFPKYQQNLVSRGKGKMMGTSTPGFTEATKFSTGQSIDQMKQQYKYFSGGVFEQAAEATGQKVDDLIERYIISQDVAPIGLDLTDVMNRRIVAHARSMQRAKMVEEFREFGIRIDDLGISTEDFKGLKKGLMRQGWIDQGGGIPQAGLQNVQDAAFEGYLFDEEMAGIINRVYQASSSDAAIQATKNMYGKITGLWKGYATFSSGFHMRNHISNNFTGFMRHGADWFNPQKNVDAWAAAYYATHPDKYMDLAVENLGMTKGNVARVLNKEINGHKVMDLIDYAKEKGLVGWGTFFSDVEKQVASPGSKIRKAISPLSQENVLLKKSRSTGDLLETKAKLQSFMMTFEQIAKGEMDEGIANLGNAALKNAGALEWAKMDTQKWFINYNDLSEFERKIMKPIMPFYTWMRKNIANQLNAITMFPGVYALSADATKEFTLEGFPMVLQPEWQKDLGYIPVGQDEQGQYTMFFPNLPYQDLNKIPFEWEPGKVFPTFKGRSSLDELISNANPLIKTFIENVTKYNTFKKREYLDYVEAPGLAQFLGKSPKIVGALDQMMRWAGNENGLRINERNGKVQIDEEIERVLTTNLPGLRAFEKVIDAGIDITDLVNAGFEAMVEARTGRKDDHEGLEDLLQTMSYFGGVKFKTFQEEYERERANEGIEERAQELQREERRRLPGYDQRVRDYLQKQDDRYRRRGLY